MSGHVFWVGANPYLGLAESIITSNIVDLRDALSWSWSWRTTGGTTSAHTFQLSNSTLDKLDDVPTASFVDYVAFGTGTPAVTFGEAGVRYGRVLRSASGASVVVEFNKQVG